MREALARSDHDFVLREPARAHRRRRAGVLSALVAIFRFIQAVAAYPNRVGGALIVGLSLAILVNALVLQHKRRPATLIHIGPAASSTTRHHRARHEPRHTAARLAQPELKAARPASDPIGKFLKSETSAGHHAPAAHASPAAPAPTNLHRHTAARAAASDPISRFLHTNPSPSATARVELVRAVQHALVKLGYVLRADGAFGTNTRRAIAQYERAHGLPADGKLTPQLLRKLAAESGIAMR